MTTKLKLIAKKELAQDVFELTLEGDIVLNMKAPGQFIHIKVPRHDLILRRPISLSDIDHKNKQCKVVIRPKAEGTWAIVQAELNSELDCLGPLGHGFPIDDLKAQQTALLIGGGIGIPPLLECAKQLHSKGVIVTTLLGFQNKAAVFYEEDFKAYGSVHISTDDGSYCTHGSVVTLLDQLNRPYDAIYACGPRGLNQMVNKRFKIHPLAYISLEERMACGMGACAGCTVLSQDGQRNYRVCKDGPVFKTNEVQP